MMFKMWPRRMVILFLNLFCSLSFLVAEDMLFVVKEDTPVWAAYENLRIDGTVVKNLAKGTIVSGVMGPELGDINKKKTYISRCSYQNELFIINSDALIPAQTKDLFDTSFLTDFSNLNRKIWVVDYYVEVLKSKNKETLYKYEKGFWSKYDSNPDLDDYYKVAWYKILPVDKLVIFQSAISLGVHIRYKLWIKKIEIIPNGYRITVKGDSSYTDSLEWGVGLPVPWPSQQEREFFDFLLIPDGDYLDIYLDNLQTKFATFILVDTAFINQFEQLLEGYKINLSNITWPRRADGTSDFDVQNITNVEVGVSYRTTDNLRLRSAEETTSDIMTTLEKDTRVTVIELGKQQTIDGITANWVKVHLDDGTEGWCFGGYLEEAVPDPEPVSFEQEEIKTDSDPETQELITSDQNNSLFPFPLLPIAGGALALIIVCVILIIKKKHNSLPEREETNDI